MDNRLKLNTEPLNALSIDGMKSKVLATVVSEEAYNSNYESIVKHVDPSKKNWTPFKVKKALVDQLHHIILASPKEHPAVHKLMALKLIN